MGPSPIITAADSGRWRIHLLGEFRAQRGERRASFRTQKTGQLLAYLAFYQGKVLSKEALADLFWSESEPSLARQSLRMALSDIRSELRCPDWDPDHHFLSDRNTIEVREGAFWTDSREMLALLDSAAGDIETLRDAVGLYAGRFLPHSEDSWVYPQALEIEERYAQAVCALVPELPLSEAVSVGRRAIALCAPREDLHAALIRAYSEAGQASAALRQYEELETLLDDLWGERPSDSTTLLLSDLPRHDPEGMVVIETLVSEEIALSDSTQFVGREVELAELLSVLNPVGAGPRLWTLVGLGGTGKTRLAIRAAEALQAPYGNRVYFVSFAHIQSANQMWDSLANLASSKSQDEAAILDAMAARIGSQAALVILDNVEQVAEPVAATLAKLLDRCPPLRILATSRIPLGAPSERLLRLPPLALPLVGCSIDELKKSPAVMLLTDAAQASRQGFAVTPNNAEGVRLLCHFLEGLPLALVLAASRLGAQTPTQVAASLSRRADLCGQSAGLKVRHQSLESVVQWSLDQLSTYERAAFLKLAICRGDFDASLAQAILGSDALILVENFSRHALLTWEETTDSLRYRMLETIREVAFEELDLASALYGEALERLTDWVVNFGRQLPPASSVLRESSHLLTVLEAGAESHLAPEIAWETAGLVQSAIAQTGRAYLWLDALEALLAATKDQLSPADAAFAFGVVADAQYAVRNIQRAYALLNSAIDEAEKSGDPGLRIATLLRLRIPATLLGKYDRANLGLEQAYKLAEGTPALAEVAAGLGWLELCQDRAEKATEYFATASQGASDLQDAARAELLMGWATALACAHDPRAQQKFADSELALATAHTPDLTARHRYLRAWTNLKHGSLREAESDIMDCLRIYEENGIALGQTPLTIAGIILSKSGRKGPAVAAWARAENARRLHSMSLLPMLEPDYREALESDAITLGNLKWSKALKEEALRSDLEFLEGAFNSTSSA